MEHWLNIGRYVFFFSGGGRVRAPSESSNEGRFMLSRLVRHVLPEAI